MTREEQASVSNSRKESLRTGKSSRGQGVQSVLNIHLMYMFLDYTKSPTDEPSSCKFSKMQTCIRVSVSSHIWYTVTCASSTRLLQAFVYFRLLLLCSMRHLLMKTWGYWRPRERMKRDKRKK